MSGPEGQNSAVAPDLAAGEGRSFSDAVRRMFDSLAPRYDRFNRWASLGMDVGWRRATLRSLEISPDAVVLDVATGTGDLALAAARWARRVIGCDFAPEMIRIASRKAERRGRVRFQVARAEALPYRHEAFDGVTSAFAMRNVKPVLDEVLAEAHRVLRPGGRLAILEFSRPRVAPVRWAHDLYTRWIMPLIGRALTGSAEPFEYLYRSISDWDTPEAFAGRLREAGFEGVGYRLMGLGTVALHTARKAPADGG